MTLIYLIRHGENDFVGKRLAGWLPNVHLNDRGRAQAKALAETLRNHEFAAVYSSPLDRTMETADLIARANGNQAVPRQGLIEIQFGQWEGKDIEAIRQDDLISLLEKAPSLFRFPNGETPHEAQTRVVMELETLRALHPEQDDKIACISHADVIKLALAHYLGLSLDLYRRITIDVASISVLQILDHEIRILGINNTQPPRAISQE